MFERLASGAPDDAWAVAILRRLDHDAAPCRLAAWFRQWLSRMNPRFTGNNVLIVEDETLLALMLEDLLLDSGHRVVHANSLPDAMAVLENEQFDAAILDININGNDVFPVAARLREMNIPFVFASASDAERIGPEFREEQLIAKPYTIGQVQQSLNHMLSSSAA